MSSHMDLMPPSPFEPKAFKDPPMSAMWGALGSVVLFSMALTTSSKDAPVFARSDTALMTCALDRRSTIMSSR